MDVVSVPRTWFFSYKFSPALDKKKGQKEHRIVNW